MTERATALNARIADRLWDAERKVFANRLWSGKFVRSLAPPSFYPLLSGAARPEQAEAMVAMLSDPRKFGGQWMLASVTRDDPAFGDNVYWRGRVWPPLNFLVYQGLKRAGFADVASELADNGFRLFQGEWHNRRHCPENYNSVSGQALDQPDTDSFYGWGALMPAIAVAELSDINPWGGWEVTHGESICLGPLQTPLGLATIEAGEGVLRITTGGKPRFATNIKGRFTHLSIGAKAANVVLPPGPAGWIEFPDLGKRVSVQARDHAQGIEVTRGKS